MTKSVIKICNSFHYFFREGGYLHCDQFSLLFFSLFMVGGGGPKGNSAKFIIFLVFFLMTSLTRFHCIMNYCTQIASSKK